MSVSPSNVARMTSPMSDANAGGVPALPPVVGVELEWDGDAGATRHLRLPDGTLVTLTHEQFVSLEESIPKASYDHCGSLAREQRRAFLTPGAHGLTLLTTVVVDYKQCWQVPSLPNGPVIAYADNVDAWQLTVMELGQYAFTTPLGTVAWNDAEGLKDLCLLAHNPEAALTLAALTYPHELAEASIHLAWQFQWDEVLRTSQMLLSLVKGRASRFVSAGNPVEVGLRFKQVGVRRKSLKLSEPPRGFNDVALIGAEVILPKGKRFTREVISWIEKAMAGGRTELSVVEHGGRVFITRNPALLMDCLGKDILEHFASAA